MNEIDGDWNDQDQFKSKQTQKRKQINFCFFIKYLSQNTFRIIGIQINKSKIKRFFSISFSLSSFWKEMISNYASFSMRWYFKSVSALTVQKYSLGKAFVISFELCIHNKIHFNRVLEIVTMNNNQKMPKTFLSLKNIDWRLLLFLCSIFRFFISYFFFLFFGFWCTCSLVRLPFAQTLINICDFHSVS